MKSKPNFASSTQWIKKALGRREKRSTHRCVAHARQMTHDDVQGVHWIARNHSYASLESLLERIKWHLICPFDGHVKFPVITLSGQCHFKFNLKTIKKRKLTKTLITGHDTHALPIYLITTYRQWITGVQISLSIKNWSIIVKNPLLICLNHCFDNFSKQANKLIQHFRNMGKKIPCLTYSRDEGTLVGL